MITIYYGRIEFYLTRMKKSYRNFGQIFEIFVTVFQGVKERINVKEQRNHQLTKPTRRDILCMHALLTLQNIIRFDSNRIALYGKSNKQLIIHACEVMYADFMKGRFFLKEDKHRIKYSKDNNIYM